MIHWQKDLIQRVRGTGKFTGRPPLLSTTCLHLSSFYIVTNLFNSGAGGLCRTCSVSVLRGGDLLNPQKVSEKQMLQENPRWRLGCKAFVGYGMKEGEMVIQVNPNQW